MSFIEISAITGTFFFTIISLWLVIKQRKIRADIQKREEVQKQRLYQVAILKEIQDKIGYSLDIDKVIDVITGSLKYLFPYSTSSSLLIKRDKIIFKTYVEQSVSSKFIIEVKNTMKTSLLPLIGNLPEEIEEYIQGVPLDDTKTPNIGSFFNIPLVIGKNVVGIINVSSMEKGKYKDEEVKILYEIVEQAFAALSRLEAVLETEKVKLTSLISSLVDGVFMVDMNKNLTIINDAAKSFLKISSVSPSFSDILASFGQQYNLLYNIDLAIKTNTQITEKEVSINGKVFQTFITPVSSVSANQNKPIGASILLHDITVEKNINTIKEDFTHMIVHELRAPLTAIKDSAELMIEVFEDKGILEKEQQRRLLKIIEQQSKNLLEQINQVLDAAKIEAGKFSINKVESDMGEIIGNAVEFFLPQAGKKQILLSADVYYPLPKVNVDPSRISQVLNNLISNSLKFTPDGGKIVVSAKPGNGILTVSVSDNGMGIPENEQKDLFSKYYQIRTTPHQLAKKGTGLGLYITKGIVEAHEGTVGVISSEGKGTSIYFTLPFEQGGPRIIQGHLPQNKITMGSSLSN